MRISDWSSDVCSSDLRPALLLSGLWINETHFGPLGRDYNRLGVRRIVFLALHERFDVPRCNQLHLMAKLGHLACPVMRAATGLHHDPCRRLFRQELGKTKIGREPV